MTDARLGGAPVTVDAVGWGWRHAGRRAWAVREASFRIEPGERVLLLGASGSGKSTLLAGLAGVLGGDDDGDAVGRLTLDGRAPADARGRAGLLLQDPDAQLVLARVGDDVAFACENLGVPREEIWSRVRAALAAVGLAIPLDHPTQRLSGGQKQRLALAGLLAMRPGLLLLDEPTANLDPEGVVEVRDAVGRAVGASGATLVVVEHRVAVWRGLVDRVIVLDAEGGLLADGVPEKVLVTQAAALRAAGVWLPDEAVDAAPAGIPGDELLRARALVAGRVGGPAIDGAGADGAGIRVQAGVATALTGRNGSGKTTLALTLGGLLRPRAGVVEAAAPFADGAGAAPHTWSSRQLLTRIGSVFQNPEHQLLTSTVRAELELGPRALRMREAEYGPRVDDILARLRLDRLALANPFTLSGGQKRRLSVATAIATRPRVLVLDEPTFGQDAVTWRELVELLVELRDEGHAIVAATHDVDFIAAVGAVEHRLDTQSSHSVAGGR